MIELLGSIGVIGVLLLVFGFVVILGLAKLVDEKNKQEIWEMHCASCRTINCLACQCDDKECCIDAE